MQLDHVLIAVSDLDAAARRLRSRYGLASVEGGRHPGWGTANRIVPLGETYLELVTVAHEADAAGSAFGRWVANAASGSGRLLGWAVRTEDIGAVARRLNLDVQAGLRAAPDRELLRWRSAGMDRAAADPSLPFFIEWGPGAVFPGRSVAPHKELATISGLTLTGDADRLTAWLGDHSLPISVRSGTPALTGVVLRGAGGERVLGPV